MAKNIHIIVGSGGRCLCGIYEGQAIGCGQILNTLDRLEAFAKAEQSPSLLIRKGGHAPFPPTASEILLIRRVLKDLEKDCQ